ncbi:hypothetical protein ELBR111191_12450 [Elizabethkingia bruuniana]|nr:hypothetical protein VO54_03800 [Elizabethkingia miricola]
MDQKLANYEVRSTKLEILKFNRQICKIKNPVNPGFFYVLMLFVLFEDIANTNARYLFRFALRA